MHPEVSPIRNVATALVFGTSDAADAFNVTALLSLWSPPRVDFERTDLNLDEKALSKHHLQGKLASQGSCWSLALQSLVSWRSGGMPFGSWLNLVHVHQPAVLALYEIQGLFVASQ